MTHYAFATSLMNLMLVPTAMISGPLAEHFGFSTFFAIVMFASVPSVWAAWRAPFPLPPVASVGEDGVAVTVDDPSRLSLRQRKLQRIAGRASMYALLQLLVILIVDSRILGQLQAATDGRSGLSLTLLGVSAAVKLWLSWLAWKWARAARRARPGGSDVAPYQGNARGAMVATGIACAASLGVLLVGFRLAG